MTDITEDDVQRAFRRDAIAKELQALETIVSILDDLPKDTLPRVLWYLGDRFKAKP